MCGRLLLITSTPTLSVLSTPAAVRAFTTLTIPMRSHRLSKPKRPEGAVYSLISVPTPTGVGYAEFLN